MGDDFFETSEEKKEDPAFSDEEIKKYLDSKELAESSICMGIIGDNGTGKSGLALDFRTPEEVKEGKQLIIFDLDNGCMPIKLEYHNADPNIKIYDPTEFIIDENGTRVDYKKTMEKIKSICSYLIKNKEKYSKVKAVILDGVDKLLKIAEYQMKIEKHLQPDGKADYAYWNKRNIDYQQVMDMIKKLPFDKIYITHNKEIDQEQEKLREKIFKTSSTRIKLKPSWEKNTNAMMHQIVETYREDDGEKVELKGHIRKWKGNTGLEGKDFVFCSVNKESGKVNWEGIKKIIKS